MSEPRPTDRGTWRLVARRDFWVRLRDRGFVISTVITLAVLSILILIRANNQGSTASYDLGQIRGEELAEQAEALGARLEPAVEITVTTYHDLATAEAAVRDGQVDAAIAGDEMIAETSVPSQLGQIVQAAAIASRLQTAFDEYGVPADERVAIADQSPVDIRTLEPVSSNRDEKGGYAFVGVILLYGQLFGYGVWISTGVIEEKSSRVVEILLSAIRPRQLMAGKIVGIGLLGLGQLVCIAAFAIVLALVTGAIPVPGEAISTAALVIGWFVLGFAFYAGVFAVAGSLVSRMEELQNALTPINLVILVSFFISVGALEDPDSTLSVVASILPTSSALAMPVRISLGAAEPWQIALALVLLIGGTLLLIPLSGRLYAGAILRTGARVKLRDAWRAAS
ncbi:MAG: ABC transporter permease [Actinomycetota bacterium]